MLCRPFCVLVFFRDANPVYLFPPAPRAVGAKREGGPPAAAVGAAAAAGRALLDPSTRGLLAAGGGLLALTGGILAVRGAVSAARKRAAAAAETLADGAKAALFWGAVFVAFKLVIESS